MVDDLLIDGQIEERMMNSRAQDHGKLKILNEATSIIVQQACVTRQSIFYKSHH